MIRYLQFSINPGFVEPQHFGPYKFMSTEDMNFWMGELSYLLEPVIRAWREQTRYRWPLLSPIYDKAKPANYQEALDPPDPQEIIRNLRFILRSNYQPPAA